MTIFNSSRFAVIASTLALVIALGGTSYAAVKITGKDIKDGTVTGEDLRNGSITNPDLAGASITGSKIRRGTVQPSDLSPAAVSQFRRPTIHYTFARDRVFTEAGTPLLRLTVPSGNWLVVARMQYEAADVGANVFTHCGMYAGTQVADRVLVQVTGEDELTAGAGTLTFQTLVALKEPTDLRITCNDERYDNRYVMSWRVITAEQVGDLEFHEP